MPEVAAPSTASGWTELCQSCRQPIDTDGFCSGCGARQVRPLSERELLEQRIRQGQTGFLLFGLLAVALWSWAGGPIVATSQPGGLFSVDYRPGWDLWLVGGVLAVTVLIVGAILTSVPAAPATRLIVWLALMLAWLLSATAIFLVARQARTIQLAASLQTAETKAALEMEQARFAVRLHNYQERCQRRDRALAATRIGGLLGGGAEPDDDFDADAAKHNKIVGRLRHQWVQADALRNRALVLFVASFTLVATKMCLLFLAAAALTWSDTEAPTTEPNPPAQPVRA